MAIKCQLTRDLMVRGWNFPYCNFPPRLSYTTRSAIFHRLCSTRSATFHKERKWESFFFFFSWQRGIHVQTSLSLKLLMIRLNWGERRESRPRWELVRIYHNLTSTTYKNTIKLFVRLTLLFIKVWNSQKVKHKSCRNILPSFIPSLVHHNNNRK